MLYTVEPHIRILISHLKARGIKNIIASPGTQNMTFVLSCQNDSFFNIYSSVDERSAGYMAIGMAYETGEPVVLSCTGATASRNYLPAMTEGYYRNLPVIAITGSQRLYRTNNNIAQAIDRSIQPKDTYKYQFIIDRPLDKEDINDLHRIMNNLAHTIKVNPGPVHINLITNYSVEFSNDELPIPRLVGFIDVDDAMPEMAFRKIVIHIKSGLKLDQYQHEIIDRFCLLYDAIVICDHTSSYKGEFRILSSLILSQKKLKNALKPELIIEIGNITGDYFVSKIYDGTEIWRIDHQSLTIKSIEFIRYFFHMKLNHFFDSYNIADNSQEIESVSFVELWRAEYIRIFNKIEDFPLSNIWIAKQLHNRLVSNSRIHFGILNSLRSWNFFEIDKTIESISNVGGFGIDGNLSTLIGASLSDTQKLFYAVVGDLAFFYDMNALGNREIRDNLRIILINNGTGTEFKNFNHPGSEFDSKKLDNYVAAKGHFGNRSPSLVKNYAESLGFSYFAVNKKDDFLELLGILSSHKHDGKSHIFEVFVDEKDESDALETIISLDLNAEAMIISNIKKSVVNTVGSNNAKKIKKFLGR